MAGRNKYIRIRIMLLLLICFLLTGCGKSASSDARDEEAFGPDGSYSRTDLYYFEAGNSYRISVGQTGNFHNTGQGAF